MLSMTLKNKLTNNLNEITHCTLICRLSAPRRDHNIEDSRKPVTTKNGIIKLL